MDQLAVVAECTAIAQSLLKPAEILNAPEELDQDAPSISAADILGATGRRGRRLTPTQRSAVEAFFAENGPLWSEVSGVRQVGSLVVTPRHVSSFIVRTPLPVSLHQHFLRKWDVDVGGHACVFGTADQLQRHGALPLTVVCTTVNSQASIVRLVMALKNVV